MDAKQTTTDTRKLTPALLRRTPRRSAESVMAMIREHEERRVALGIKLSYGVKIVVDTSDVVSGPQGEMKP